MFQVLDERGELVDEPLLAAAERVRAYERMVRVRMLDTRMMALQRQGRIGFYGACTGQEAVPVAATLALDPDDWVFPGLRESTIMLWRGFSLELYLAQLFGNRLDRLKGRQMPNHMSSRAARQVSWSSAIGTQLPHAVGAAWAAKMKGESVVSFAFLGDGATSVGDFHNALNFAAVFHVPCVFVCQNNQFAISLPAERQSAAATLADRALAYGITAQRVDGNDVLAVHQALHEARVQATDGAGPCFVECVTFRMGAHSTSDDPDRYRSPELVRSWQGRDPLLRMRRHLHALGLLDESEEREVERRFAAILDEAIQRVESAPPPETRTLFEDVYAAIPWHLREQQFQCGRDRPSGRG